MLFTLTLLLLTRSPPSYDPKLITGCYDYEDQPACDRRHERWNRDIQSYNDEMAEYEADDFKQLTNSKVTIEPNEGIDKIEPMKPTWCANANTNSQWASIPRNLERFKDSKYLDFSGLFFAAQMACKKPDDKDVQRFVGYAVQGYANITHVSAADAVKNFSLRLDDKLIESKNALCSKMVADEEDFGSKKVFAGASRLFFGCTSKGKNEGAMSAQWTESGGKYLFESMQYYLDTTSEPESELMRLSYLLDLVHTPEDDYSFKYSTAAQYAWLQHDMKGLNVPKLMKELESEPFQGNAYAAMIVSESLGIYQNRAKEFEAFVKKIAKDDDWKNVLYVAPLKAVKDWEALAAKYKVAFDNSKAFEDKLFQPSLKAAKGCSTQLRADFTAFLKTLKAPAAEFENTVTANPIGTLLLERLAACEAVDGHSSYSKALRTLHESGRVSRGPRMAAYYATLEAMADVLKDRPKFPLDPKSFWAPRNSGDMQTRANEADKTNGEYFGGMQASVVKSVSKTAAGTKITFITEKYQYMSYNCTPTNRLKRIDSNGNLEYYSNCREAGMKSAENRVPDVTIDTVNAANISPGKWLEFAAGARGDTGMPLRVFSDKSKSKMVNWYGFGL